MLQSVPWHSRSVLPLSLPPSIAHLHSNGPRLGLDSRDDPLFPSWAASSSLSSAVSCWHTRICHLLPPRVYGEQLEIFTASRFLAPPGSIATSSVTQHLPMIYWFHQAVLIARVTFLFIYLQSQCVFFVAAGLPSCFLPIFCLSSRRCCR